MSLARNLVDTQPRYAYTTWAPKAKFCLQKAAWNISRSRASPKRGAQGLGRRCTLSPRIGSPSLTQSWDVAKPMCIGCWKHLSFICWGSRCSASALCETCLVFSTNWYDICIYLWVHPWLDSWRRRNHQDTWVFLKHLGRNLEFLFQVQGDLTAMCCWVVIVGYCNCMILS